MKKSILVLTLMTTLATTKAQTYRNKEWVKNYGAPDSIEWSATTKDIYLNIITIGNTKITGEKTNILITKFDNLGAVVWQTDWNGPKNGFDYGVDIISDNWGYIYAIGASHYNNETTFDIAVIKYDESGNQIWQTNYDNEGKNDYPVKLTNDMYGNIYITGSSEGATTGFDFITLKIDTSGNIIWNTRYDYNNHIDVAADIVNDGIGAVTTVTGGSEDSMGIWDYTTITYDVYGNQMDIDREPASGSEINKPRDIAKDAYGNYYIAGAYNNGTDNDIKLIKLDSTLAAVWISVYNNSSGGTDEEGNALTIDDSGYIYIGGWQQSPGSNERTFLVVKYNQSGGLVWEQTLWPDENKPLAEITNLKVKDNNLDVIGFCINDYNSDIITARFNTSDGDLDWMETWENDKESIDFPSGIEQVGQDIYVTGRTTDNNNVRWVVVKYSSLNRDTSVFRDTLGNPLFSKNELIVRFDHEAVKTEAINTTPYKETEFGNLNTFLEDTEADIVLNKLDGLYNAEVGGIKVFKIFRNMSTFDTTTLSRLGETIPIPKFWATFILQFPDGSDISEIADSLNTLFPLVKYVHPNMVAYLHSSANDSMYSEQASLHPNGSYDSGHINIAPAWALTEARPWIRVGVFDDGIYWKHEDFNYSGNTTNSSVVGGWDFDKGRWLKSYDGDGYHGTPVAGIIGAVRNNGKGVAGIAGRNDSIPNTGVSIYGLKIFDIGYFGAILNYIADAYIESTINDTKNNPSKKYRYGINICHNSWGLSSLDAEHFTDTNITLINEAIHFMNRVKVACIASSGNFSSIPIKYPAITDDDWVTCVGGTGFNGKYKTWISGDSTEDWEPSIGPEMDIAAPATQKLIRSLTMENTYSEFKGTSAASPHVTGVAALLMSYLNDSFPSPSNLAPEDIEYILQMTANDVNDTGYDVLTGYGRLNAGAALQAVNKAKRRILHWSSDSLIYGKSKTRFASNQTIALTERYKNEAGIWFKPGTYTADVFKIDGNISHYSQMGRYDSVVAMWPRPSSSNLFPLYGSGNKLIPRERIVLNTIHTNYGEFSGYVYGIKNSLGNYVAWWPFDTTLSKARFSYTVLIENTYKPNLGVVKPVHQNNDVAVYPNPTCHKQMIVVKSSKTQNLEIELYDVSGRLIKNVYLGKAWIGEQLFDVDVSDISNGIYFYKIKIGNSQLHFKIIKQ